MSSFTPRLALKRNDGSDPFLLQDFVDNWNKLDAAPGLHICLSTTRPTWGTDHTGRKILETDTGLEWRWTGTAFVRTAAIGRLAVGNSSSTVSNSSTTTRVSAVTLSNVSVPSGGRDLMAVLTWLRVQNSGGVCYVSLIRDGIVVDEWQVAGDSTSPTPGANGTGGSIVHTWAVSPGVRTFQFAIRSTPTYGGTSTVEQARLAIIEV